MNLLVNGSFEDVGLAPGVQTLATNTWANYSSLPGWSSGPYGIEVRNNVAGQAQDGNHFVELDTTRNSIAMQSLTTIAGELYELSFFYAARPGTSGMAADTNNIAVYWNNVQLGLSTGVGTGSTHNWLRFDYAVLGTGTDTLEFRALGTSDSHGGSLDNVSLQQVPEPGSIALVLGALVAAGAVRRRQDRQA
ncbi:MAG: PEP-CTERM sorting domain-containing protein [Rubrivivax sp.]